MIKVALAGLLGRKLRTALTAIAIVLGVAMISGTFVLTDSIDKAFSSIFTDVRKGSSVVVSGKSAFDLSQGQGSFAPTLNESLLDTVRNVPGVAAVEGSVNGEALLVDHKGKAIVFGGAPNLGFSIANPQSPFNVLRLEAGSWPHGNEVVIGKSTADRKHFHVGDTIGVQAEGPVQKLKISGLVTFGSAASLGGATLAGFDLPTAQRLFDKKGKLDEIAVAAAPNVSDAEILQRVQAVLPSTAQARLGTVQAAKDAADTNSFVTFLRGFLLAFGGIALFVGSFVIANSLSITIAQRTRELATMRTLGASRRQVLTSIIVEALVIGALASVVGLFLGLGLAKGLFSLFDLVGFTLPNNGLTFATRTIVVSIMVGVLVALIASLRPAIRATRVPPIAAVREGATLPPSRFARYRTAGVDPDHRRRVRGAPLRALRQRPEHDGDPGLDGHRSAADLLRRRDVRRSHRGAVRSPARLAGDEDRGRRRLARTRQRASQSAAHRVHRIRADDRPRAGDARRGAGAPDHAQLPRRRRQDLAQRRLRGHGAEQLQPDSDDGCERRGEEPGRRGRRQRSHRRRGRVR